MQNHTVNINKTSMHWNNQSKRIVMLYSLNDWFGIKQKTHFRHDTLRWFVGQKSFYFSVI